jgi:hypothetical protein
LTKLGRKNQKKNPRAIAARGVLAKKVIQTKDAIVTDLIHDYNQQADARMARIDQVILPVDVIDVYVIVVVPAGRPRFRVLKIVAAIIEAAIAALHVEVMCAAEIGTKLLLWNAPATTPGIGVIVLRGLLRALLILWTVLLLGGLCCLAAIAIVLLLLLGAIILLRGLGAILFLLGGFLLRFVRGLFLVLLTLIGLFAFLWFFTLLGLFLLFRFFLRLILIGFLPRINRSADKQKHQGCAEDEFHLIPPVVGDVMSRRIHSLNELGLAGMVTSSTAAARPR